jgi:hypothetical protein
LRLSFWYNDIQQNSEKQIAYNLQSDTLFTRFSYKDTFTTSRDWGFENTINTQVSAQYKTPMQSKTSAPHCISCTLFEGEDG